MPFTFFIFIFGISGSFTCSSSFLSSSSSPFLVVNWIGSVGDNGDGDGDGVMVSYFGEDGVASDDSDDSSTTSFSIFFNVAGEICRIFLKLRNPT